MTEYVDEGTVVGVAAVSGEEAFEAARTDAELAEKLRFAADCIEMGEGPEGDLAEAESQEFWPALYREAADRLDPPREPVTHHAEAIFNIRAVAG